MDSDITVTENGALWTLTANKQRTADFLRKEMNDLYTSEQAQKLLREAREQNFGIWDSGLL